MIEHVDRAVERFFRAKTPLPETSVAVSFETPDRAWGSARTRPTVSVFLWEIVRNPRALRSGMEQRVDESGAKQRRPITPVVDLHYLITAWASEPRDEHQLLGGILSTILAHNRMPDDVLPEPLAGKRCGLSLAPWDMRVPGEMWTSLGGAPRAAIQLEVSLPLDVFAWRDVAPPAEQIGAKVDRVPAPPPKREDEDIVVTRRRVNGMLVMEGRPAERGPQTPES